MIESIIVALSAVLLLVTGMAVQKYLIDSSIDNTIPRSFMKTKADNSGLASSIVLDETKVVLKIDTSSLEKKAAVVGETVVKNNDTANAISKLKNMKGT